MQKDLAKIISLFEDHYKQNGTYVSLHQTSGAKDISYEETNLIFNNPLIFFPASKSRVVLVTWICKHVREIFEKYEFSDIEIPTESYEIIRQKFNTKAFNRHEFCRLFGCEKKTLLSYDEFIELEKTYIDEYNKAVSDENKLSSITHISIKKNQPKPNLGKEFLNIIKDEKSKEILLLRNMGQTLDEVGSRMKLTRERVRQIESKPKMLIVRWMNGNLNDIKNSLCDEIVLNDKKAAKVFTSEGLEILKYSLNTVDLEDNSWVYLKPIDLVICDEKRELVNLLNGLLEEMKEKEENNLNDFVEILHDSGYAFFTKDLAAKYLKENGFNTFDDEVHFGKMTIAKAVVLTAQELPDKKIKITSKKELEDFAKLINSNYNLKVKADRALSTRVQDILVMVDKATYSPAKYVDISKELLDKITDYIQNMKDDRISYSALFDIFKDDLIKNSTVNNHYALHGALKYNEENQNYLCLRYYVCKQEIENIKSKSYFEKLPALLMEKGALTSAQIVKAIPEWNNMYIKYAMLYYPEVVRWKEDLYINLNNLKITEEEKTKFIAIVRELLNNKYKYTSSYILFEKVSEKIPAIIKNNNIDDEKQIYYIAQYYLSSEFKFRKPHIIDNEKIGDTFTTDDLVRLIAGRTKIVDKKELTEDLISYYGNKNSSLSLSLQRVLADYVRIGKNLYIAKNKLKLTEEEKSTLISCLDNNAIQGEVIIPESIHDYSAFPDLGFKWNSWAICGVVNEIDLGYRKVVGASNISIHSNTPIVKNDSTLKTKEEVLKWIIENEYKGEKTRENILRYFRNMDVYNINNIVESIIGE